MNNTFPVDVSATMQNAFDECGYSEGGYGLCQLSAPGASETKQRRNMPKGKFAKPINEEKFRRMVSVLKGDVGDRPGTTEKRWQERFQRHRCPSIAIFSYVFPDILCGRMKFSMGTFLFVERRTRSTYLLPRRRAYLKRSIVPRSKGRNHAQIYIFQEFRCSTM